MSCSFLVRYKTRSSTAFLSPCRKFLVFNQPVLHTQHPDFVLFFHVNKLFTVMIQFFTYIQQPTEFQLSSLSSRLQH